MRRREVAPDAAAGAGFDDKVTWLLARGGTLDDLNALIDEDVADHPEPDPRDAA